MKICGERNASGPRLRCFGLAAIVAIFSAVAPLSRNVGFTANALDPSACVITDLLLAGVSLSAMLVPARRATGVDPMTVLRDE
jgi:ABC-type lipoprotein release transport system permease subunit